MRTLRRVFAEVLAFELDVDMTPEWVDACDVVLMRLWMEGYKVVPLDGSEGDDVSLHVVRGTS